MIHTALVKAALTAANTRFITVKFRKMDGTVRTVNGLLNPKSKMANKGRITVDPSKVTETSLVPIWHPKEGWKSFRVNSVISINAESVKMDTVRD